MVQNFLQLSHHISTEVGYFYLMKNDTLLIVVYKWKKNKGSKYTLFCIRTIL